jgi:hypothetical protein
MQRLSNVMTSISATMGVPEPLATINAQRGTWIDVSENLELTTTVQTRRHTRVESEQNHAAPDPVEPTHYLNQLRTSDNKEIWQIIESLQHTINEQRRSYKPPELSREK